MKPTAFKAYERIIDCIQYQQKPLELLRNGTSKFNTQNSIKCHNESISKDSAIMSPRSLYMQTVRSSIYSTSSDQSSSILIPNQSTANKSRNPEKLLSDFRLINKVVRKNKSSELVYRMNHKPRFSYETQPSLMPKSLPGRAPKLTTKMAGMQFCSKLVEQSLMKD